jgi:hypothetical protein
MLNEKNIDRFATQAQSTINVLDVSLRKITIKI